MRALIIDESVRAEIARVIKHAEENITTILKIAEGFTVGDHPGFSCEIPHGYRAVYSIEDQSAGYCRHLSISVDKLEKLPSVQSVELIIKEFGFINELPYCKLWMEGVGTDHPAVNVLEVIEERNADN